MDLRQTVVLMLTAGVLLVSANTLQNCTRGWLGSTCAFECRCSDKHCYSDGSCRLGVLCETGWYGTRCENTCRCEDDKCTKEGACGRGVECQRGWAGPACQYDCRSGWFGSLCQYKCRCADNKCTYKGACGPGIPCQKGWFGPACQYVDLAYDGASARDATDGNDTTCLETSTDKEVTVPLGNRYHVTWIRVRLSKPDLLYNLTVHFKRDYRWDADLSCTNTRTARVDNTTLDIHCDLSETVYYVVLSGKGLQHLCSVHISGGRNVALRQNSSQSSTYVERAPYPAVSLESYPSKKAVDGNSNPVFYEGFTCSRTNKDDKHANLNITFSIPQHVTRYVVYNRGERRYIFPLKEFELRSFGTSMTLVFNYTDRSQHPRLVYTVIPDKVSPTIRLVNVAVSDQILALCELEVYGDSACQSGKYGRECEHTCHCAGRESCFVSTGGCPSGCAAGFMGQDCKTACNPGTYGPWCQYSCSQFCATGNDRGQHVCSKANGTCLYGCLSGYQGSTCVEKLSSNDNMDVVIVVVPVVVGVGVLVLVVVAVVFRRRRQTTTPETLGDSPAKTNDYISWSRNDPSKVHETLPDDGHDAAEVSTAGTQMTTQIGSQG